ncbi:MAG: tetratricopeptide repeat protein [Pseudomonadota bacterium]
MRHFILIGVIVASLVVTQTVSWAQVQGPEEQSEVPEAQAAPEASGPTALPDDERARAEHLDTLFERLGKPDNDNWERTAAQINAAWNQSGSPSMDLIASRADKAMAQKDYDTALLHLNDLTRLAPDFAEGWNKRATLYFVQGNYGLSLDDIAMTLRLEPRHYSALSGLGIILDRIGDKKGALEAYRRAVAIHPNLPGVEDGIRKLTKEVEGQRL